MGDRVRDHYKRREKRERKKKSSHSRATNNPSLHNPTLPFHVNILWTEHKWQNQYIMAACQPAQKGTEELTEIDDIPARILHHFGHGCDWNRQRFIVQPGTVAILDCLFFPSLLPLPQSPLFCIFIPKLIKSERTHQSDSLISPLGEVVVLEGGRLHPTHPCRALCPAVFDYNYTFHFDVIFFFWLFSPSCTYVLVFDSHEGA